MSPDDSNTGCAEITLFGVKIAVSSDGGDGGDDGGADDISRTKTAGNIDNSIPENVVTAAADAAHVSGSISEGKGSISEGNNDDSTSHERKRGTPWTEEEHRSFLEGLRQLGKGDWKGISSKFVPSRKSSQVASHAQKYFNRMNMSQDIKKRRRASVFDITSNHDTASSSSAAANVNSNEPSMPTHVPYSERQPLAPAKQSIQYQTPSIPTHVPNSERPPLAPAKQSIQYQPPTIPTDHVPNSERPPVAPVKQSIQDTCSIIYQTKISSITKVYQPQASISWIPVVCYPNQQNGVFVPHGGFVPHQPWQQAPWIRSAQNSRTKNDEINIHIRNVAL